MTRNFRQRRGADLGTAGPAGSSTRATNLGGRKWRRRNFYAETYAVRLGTEHLWAELLAPVQSNLGRRKCPKQNLPPGATLRNVAQRGSKRGFADPCSQLRQT